MESKDRRVLGHSIVLERQERFSIETSERIYFKDRRLYPNPPVDVARTSSSSDDIEKIHRTRERVENLNNRINREIERLKEVNNSLTNKKEERFMTWAERFRANRPLPGPVLVPNRDHGPGRGRRAYPDDFSKPALKEVNQRDVSPRKPPPQTLPLRGMSPKGQKAPPMRLPGKELPPKELTAKGLPPKAVPSKEFTSRKPPPRFLQGKDLHPRFLHAKEPSPKLVPPEGVSSKELALRKPPPQDLPAKELPPKRLPPKAMVSRNPPPRALPAKEHQPKGVPSRELASRKSLPRFVPAKELPLKAVPSRELAARKSQPRFIPAKEKDIPAKKVLPKELASRNPPPKHFPAKELPPRALPAKELLAKGIQPKDIPVKRFPTIELPTKEHPPEALMTRQSSPSSTQKEQKPKEVITKKPMPKEKPIQIDLSSGDSIPEEPRGRVRGGCCHCYCHTDPCCYPTGQDCYITTDGCCNIEFNRGVQYGIPYCTARRRVTDLNTQDICGSRCVGISPDRNSPSKKCNSKVSVKETDRKSPIRGGRTPPNREKVKSPKVETQEKLPSPERDLPRGQRLQKIEIPEKIMKGKPPKVPSPEMPLKKEYQPPENIKQKKKMEYQPPENIKQEKKKEYQPPENIKQDKKMEYQPPENIKQKKKKEYQPPANIKHEKPEVSAPKTEVTKFDVVSPRTSCDTGQIFDVDERMCRDYLSLYYQENSKEVLPEGPKLTPTYTRLQQENVKSTAQRPFPMEGQRHSISQDCQQLKPSISDQNNDECLEDQDSKSSIEWYPHTFSYESCFGGRGRSSLPKDNESDSTSFTSQPVKPPPLPGHPSTTTAAQRRREILTKYPSPSTKIYTKKFIGKQSNLTDGAESSGMPQNQTANPQEQSNLTSGAGLSRMPQTPTTDSRRQSNLTSGATLSRYVLSPTTDSRQQSSRNPVSLGAESSRKTNLLDTTHSSVETIVTNPQHQAKSPPCSCKSTSNEGSDDDLRLERNLLESHRKIKPGYKVFEDAFSMRSGRTARSGNESSPRSFGKPMSNDYKTSEMSEDEEPEETVRRAPNNVTPRGHYQSLAGNLDRNRDYSSHTESRCDCNGYETARSIDSNKHHNLLWGRSFSTKKSGDEKQPMVETVCEKRTRTVTFKDEQGELKKHRQVEEQCRSHIDWEQAWKHRRHDPTFPYDNYTSRSNSSAEHTCLEFSSDEGEAYDSCMETQSRKDEEMLSFKACPCMYPTYRQLAALCQSKSPCYR